MRKDLRYDKFLKGMYRTSQLIRRILRRAKYYKYDKQIMLFEEK